MKRLLVCLTCLAMMFGALGHVWAMPDDTTANAMALASDKVPASQLTEIASTQELAEFGVSMEGCIGHAHSASGGCAIDAVASSLSFDAPYRIWRVSSWIERNSRLKATASSPAAPPPISVS